MTQLLLALLQFPGLALELPGQSLGLGEELLPPHDRDDAVENHADGLDELFQEHHAHAAEGLERGELDNAQDVFLEHDGQDEDGRRPPLAQAGGDPHVVLRRIGDQDRLLLHGCLTHQSLADAETADGPVAQLVGVGRDEAQAELVAFPFGHEECAVLR